MKRIAICFFSMLMLTSLESQAQKVDESMLNLDIIPKPVSALKQSGYFILNDQTVLICDKQFKADVAYIISEIGKCMNFSIKSGKDKSNGGIIISRVKDKFDIDAYAMTIDENQIHIEASDRGGVINALSTLKQLVLTNNKTLTRNIYIPSVKINDAPQFSWRGYMIDLSRHFFSLAQMRDMIDEMAFLKFNRLHLHLSDDQGYRIECKAYPKLNTIGSWRVDHNCTDETKNAYWGKPVQKAGEFANYGGYYTHEELKELVIYAKQRNIEIIPEIDVPGHAQAIIASYPELACVNKPFTVATGAVNGNNTLCPTCDGSYELIDAIIKELVEIFPYDYIHIGGDECNKSMWSNHQRCLDFVKSEKLEGMNGLQSYFIHKVETIVNKHGKNMIGWDEILDGGLAPNATVMSWRGESGGIAAVKMGHDVIMSPNSYNYLDLKQGQSYFEPNLGYSKLLLSATYNSKVIPAGLTAEERKHVIGNQANMWTESLGEYDKLTYMLYPRLFAVAENSWSPESVQSWDDFIERLKSHLTIFDQNSVRYAKSVFNPWVHHRGEDGSIKIWFTSELNNPEIRYTTNGADPTGESLLYADTLTIDQCTTIRAAIFDKGVRLGDIQTRNFPIHKAANAKATITSAGKTDCGKKLTDLSYGDFLEAGDQYWVSYADDCTIDLQFDSPIDMRSIVVNTQRQTIAKGYVPERFEVYGMIDGKQVKLADSGLIPASRIQGRNIFTYTLACKAENVTAIQVKVYNLKSIPAGHIPSNVGHVSSYSIDEIQVF